MKCVLNFPVCKRYVDHMLPAGREPAFLPRMMHVVTANSSNAKLFQKSLALTGCLAVFLGLRHLGKKASPKGRCADQPLETFEAQEKQDLESPTSLDPNRVFTTVSPFANKGQDRSDSIMLKNATQRVPDLSSIVHAQVFGDSGSRCIAKLEGIDIAPKTRSRRNRRRRPKKTPPQTSDKTEEVYGKEALASEAPVKSSMLHESHRSVQCTGGRAYEQAKSRESITRKAETGNQSQDVRTVGLPKPDKKPRRRPNREPRPRHRHRGHKNIQQTPPRSENSSDKATEENSNIGELSKLGAPSRNGAQTCFRTYGRSQEPRTKTYDPERRSSYHAGSKIPRGHVDRVSHAPNYKRDGNEKMHWKQAPGNRDKTTGSSSSSTTNPRLQRSSPSNGYQFSKKSYNKSSSKEGYRNCFRVGNRDRFAENSAATNSFNPIINDSRTRCASKHPFKVYGRKQGDQYRSDEKPYSPRMRGQGRQRDHADLDKPR